MEEGAGFREDNTRYVAERKEGMESLGSATVAAKEAIGPIISSLSACCSAS